MQMIDRHHILHTRQHWTATKEAKSLRDSYVYRLDREVHNDIHKYAPPVPLLGYYALTSVLHNVRPNGEPLRDIDELSSAIELTTKHHKAHPIEVQLGELAVEAIRLQRQFFSPVDKTLII